MDLIYRVENHAGLVQQATAERVIRNPLYKLGQAAVNKFNVAIDFMSFTGELIISILTLLRHPWRLSWRSVVAYIEDTGFRALPIIALSTFVIGVVLTYQMGVQLEDYGANVYIVGVSGMAIMSEF